MKQFLKYWPLILLLFGSRNSLAYDRNLVARLLQEQSYAEVLDLAAQTPAADQDPYLLNAAGYAAHQSGLTSQAMDYFNRSLLQDTANVQALLYLGLIHSQQDRNAAALPYFRKLIAARPGVPRYYQLAADCFREPEQPDSVLAYLSQAYTAGPGQLTIAAAYAEALLDRKRYTAADSVITRSLAVDSLHARLLSAAIRSRYQQKQYRAVIPLATRLMMAGQVAYAPLFYALSAALQVQAYRQCIDIAQVLLLSGHETEQVLYYTAKAWAGLKEYEQSNAYLQRCVRKSLSPNAEAYLTELAGNMEQMKKWGKAQQYYDTAYYLFGNSNILYQKGLAYDKAGQPDRAVRVYKTYVQAAKQPDTAILRYVRARLQQ